MTRAIKKWDFHKNGWNTMLIYGTLLKQKIFLRQLFTHHTFTELSIHPEQRNLLDLRTYVCESKGLNPSSCYVCRLKPSSSNIFWTKQIELCDSSYNLGFADHRHWDIIIVLDHNRYWRFFYNLMLTEGPDLLLGRELFTEFEHNAKKVLKNGSVVVIDDYYRTKFDPDESSSAMEYNMSNHPSAAKWPVHQSVPGSNECCNSYCLAILQSNVAQILHAFVPKELSVFITEFIFGFTLPHVEKKFLLHGSI